MPRRRRDVQNIYNNSNKNFILPPLVNFFNKQVPTWGTNHKYNVKSFNTVAPTDCSAELPGHNQRPVFDYVVELDSQRMEQHFRMRIPFNIVHRFIDLLYKRLLLPDIGEFV